MTLLYVTVFIIIIIIIIIIQTQVCIFLDALFTRTSLG